MATDKDQTLAALDAAAASVAAARSLVVQSWPDVTPPEPIPPDPIPPGAETIYRVKAGDNLQACLTQAAADTSGLPIRILLEPGQRWTGNFTLPVKAHDLPVRIEPDFDLATNLGAGRIDPTRTDLPMLVSGGSLPVLASVKSRGWTCTGIHFDKTAPNRGIVELGSASAKSPAEVGGDFVFVQCRFLGDPVNYQKRGIVGNCRALTIDRCDMRNIGYNGEDGQCLLAYNGPGPFTIVGNYLSGGAEPILFGGGRCWDASMVPSDILIRGNHITNDYAAWQANKWTVKNLFEVKNAQRLLVEGNLFECVWKHGQDGTAIVLKACGYEPTPITRHHHSTFRHNVVRRAGQFLALIASEAGTPSTPQTLGTDDIEIADNVVSELSQGTWTGGGRAFGIGGPSSNVRISHNTIVDNKNAFLYHWNDPAVDALPAFTSRGNLAKEAAYGVFGAKVSGPGLPTIAAYLPGSAWDANAFEDNSASAKYPSGTLMIPAGALTTGGALDASFRVVDPALLAHIDSNGRPPGADIDAIVALFQQYGIAWP